MDNLQYGAKQLSIIILNKKLRWPSVKQSITHLLARVLNRCGFVFRPAKATPTAKRRRRKTTAPSISSQSPELDTKQDERKRWVKVKIYRKLQSCKLHASPTTLYTQVRLRCFSLFESIRVHSSPPVGKDNQSGNVVIRKSQLH